MIPDPLKVFTPHFLIVQFVFKMKHFNLAITLSQSNKQAIISFYQHRLIKTQFIDFQFVTSQGGPKNVNVHFSLRIRYQP